MRYRLSPHVRRLGYSESPLPLEEWLLLRQTILSLPNVDTSKRINLPPVTTSCAQCQTPLHRTAFEVTKHMKRGHTEFFCTTKCWADRQNEKNYGHAQATCQECGARAPRGVRRGSSKNTYCSNACLEKKRERDKAARRAAWPWMNCAECTVPFQYSLAHKRHRAKAGRGPIQFCGKTCADRAHSRKMSGEANPGYLHGLSPARKQAHSARAFREVRAEIRGRDQQVCALCNRAGKVHVHHINHRPLDNRWANLICVCPKCHFRLHADGKSSCKDRRIKFAQLTNILSVLAESRSTTYRLRQITTSSPTEYAFTTASLSTT